MEDELRATSRRGAQRCAGGGSSILLDLDMLLRLVPFSVFAGLDREDDHLVVGLTAFLSKGSGRPHG